MSHHDREMNWYYNKQRLATSLKDWRHSAQHAGSTENSKKHKQVIQESSSYNMCPE